MASLAGVAGPRLWLFSHMQHQQTLKAHCIVFHAMPPPPTPTPHPYTLCFSATFERATWTSEGTELHRRGQRQSEMGSGATLVDFTDASWYHRVILWYVCCPALLHNTQRQMSQDTGHFPMQQTHNLDMVSPLRAPLLTLFPSLPNLMIPYIDWKASPPPPFKSKFPFAARSAECCCLLCTHKFAEAVSCPQTSAPWSGAGEARQGLDWCVCCSL